MRFLIIKARLSVCFTGITVTLVANILKVYVQVAINLIKSRKGSVNAPHPPGSTPELNMRFQCL